MALSASSPLLQSFLQLVAGDELESDGQILINQFAHPALYLLLLLSGGLMVETETHLALLPLYMGIERTLTAEDPDHRLVQQVLCRMRRWELFLIMLVQNIVCHNV